MQHNFGSLALALVPLRHASESEADFLPKILPAESFKWATGLRGKTQVLRASQNVATQQAYPYDAHHPCVLQ